MTLPLYWRKFHRNGTFEDSVADEKFRSENFTDFFGQWLQQDGHASSIQSHDDIVSSFWEDPQPGVVAKYDIQTFMVADAGLLLSQHPEWRDAPWYSPHARFLTFIMVKEKNRQFFSSSTKEWTICIVGGANPKSSIRANVPGGSFLQVLSWDGTEFRFYQSDLANDTPRLQGWNYFGRSQDAFGPNSYLGPFNGHVNGACIMKEIHKPWLHWLNSAAEFNDSLTDDNKKALREVQWLSSPEQGLLSFVNANPDILETIITRGIQNWFNSRKKLDFFDKNKLASSPANVHRWAAHLFLTTTISLGAALQTGLTSNVDLEGADYIIPPDHLYDNELLRAAGLTQLMVDQNPSPGDDPGSISLAPIGFSDTDYVAAVNIVGLSLIESVGEEDYDKQTDFQLPGFALGSFEGQVEETLYFKTLMQNFEGTSPFNFMQPSLEDAVGVQRMQMLQKKPHAEGSEPGDEWIGLFTPKVLNAIIMIDFCNPVYSWRRGCLMQYLPQTTQYDPEKKEYDLSARFIEAIKKSPQASIKGSLERNFLDLLDRTIAQHQDYMLSYIAAVQKRMADHPVEALVDYLTLAESRRRIYRPLPLDEFATTMPFAKNLPFDVNSPLMKEMKPDGTIQNMPPCGVKFLQDWTKSLAGFDPEIVPPQPEALCPVAITALPPPTTLSVSCRRAAVASASRFASSCPVSRRRRRRRRRSASDENKAQLFARAVVDPEPPRTPNWTEYILPMIKEPHWVSGDPKAISQSWIGAMKYYGVGNWNLDNYDDVKARAVSIYQHVRTKTMPITRDPQEFWPDDVVEKFRLWVNAGCPKDASDTPSPQMLIPKPVEPRDEFRVRRDIMSLTKDELAKYQAKLDDVLQVGVLGSPWQKLGVLHAYWCLHYQEATFLWHRAYLLYVEKLIGMAIPYWNGYAAETADSTSPYAGIPPMFFEDTYVHPDDGSVRPNPLKYALALEGKSKSGKSQFVTRSSTLVNGPSDPDWDRKIGLFNTYHGQLQHCLEQKTYTSDGTVEEFGRPWANIPTFSDDQLDELYQFRFDFDGLFEQVHDNFHGWVGPDMADNTYTANDPIFLSYHANMDRLAGIFMDAHPDSQFTSSYPLQPFVDNGTAVSYDDPRRWRYTTVGDMAKDTRSLGYMFGTPVCADLPLPKSAAERHVSAKAAGGRAITVPAQILDAAQQLDLKAYSNSDAPEQNDSEKPSREGKVPYVIFANVGCTISSYRIDVFTKAAKAPFTVTLDNEDYIGEVTRIGMGPGVESMGAPSNTARRACRQPNATRVLSAKNVWYNKKNAGTEGDLGGVQIVVTDLATGQAISKKDYEGMSGFEPRVVWLPESS